MKRTTLALQLINLLAPLVPRWRRDEWRREWAAELEHTGATSSVRAIGAFADAFSLRIHAVQLDLLFNDAMLAVRNAIRRPGFTLLVTGTLALGLGVNSAVFALIDAVLLRPLPYRQPDRIVFVWQTLPQENVFDVEATPADYAAWHALRSFSSLALVSAGGSHTLTGNGEAERVRGARVTASLMPLLGVQPVVGRQFSPSEDDSSAAPVVILGDGIWRRRYGADTTVIGRSVQLDGVPHTVIGVMPPDTLLPASLAGERDIWLPARMTPDERVNDVSHNYTVIGRLADGVTREHASIEVAAFAASQAKTQPATHKGLGARIVPIAEDAVKGIRTALIVLLGGVALLLLIACANVATLLVSRAANRRHEQAVRVALGAGRGRLLTGAIVETMMLSTLGALAGLAIGDALVRAFVPAFADSLPRTALSVRIDARVAAFAMALAVTLGFFFGLLASGRRESGGLAGDLRSGGRTSPPPNITRARHLLVIAQVALAVVLLAGAGLMVRSVVRLANVSPGFSVDRVLTFRLSLDSPRYQANGTRTRTVGELLDRLGALPNVSSASVTSRIPLGGSRGANGIDIEGRTPSPGELWIVDQRHVSPDYFRTMGIRLVRGRALEPHDDERSEHVTVINRAMADRFWPNGDAINRRVRLAAGFDSGRFIRIVGIVEDVRHVSLSRPPVPEMYRPYAQAPAPDVIVVVKTAVDPTTVAPSCRAVVQSLDPNLPIYDVRTMEQRVAGSFAETRVTALMLAMTAALAAILAGIAIYGSIWYSVTQRTAEIGIRLALGATRLSVCMGVVGRALSLTGLGTLAGTAAALASAPLLAGLLYDTPPTDRATYAIVMLSVFVLTLAAAVGPARRAISVDPMRTLRSE